MSERRNINWRSCVQGILGIVVVQTLFLLSCICFLAFQDFEIRIYTLTNSDSQFLTLQIHTWLLSLTSPLTEINDCSPSRNRNVLNLTQMVQAFKSTNRHWCYRIHLYLADWLLISMISSFAPVPSLNSLMSSEVLRSFTAIVPAISATVSTILLMAKNSTVQWIVSIRNL